MEPISPPPRLEIWRHRAHSERYAVLAFANGVCLASGPLSDADVRKVQRDGSNAKWSAALGESIYGHEDEYEILWPARSG